VLLCGRGHGDGHRAEPSGAEDVAKVGGVTKRHMSKLTRALEDTSRCLATAASEVEQLPHSERRILIWSMLMNQGKVLTLILELARQEEKE